MRKGRAGRRAGVWECGRIGGGRGTGNEKGKGGSSKKVGSGRNRRKLLTTPNTSQSKKE